MNYTSPRDPEYYKNKREIEQRAQVHMDSWYRGRGYEITERQGDYQHDLTLRRNGNQYRVEEKYRETDFGDFLVEIIQDMVNEGRGWFYTETPDRLCYVIIDDKASPTIVYWIKFEEFKNWFFKYLADKKKITAIVSNKGNGLTLNISIPWNVIPKDIVQKFINKHDETNFVILPTMLSFKFLRTFHLPIEVGACFDIATHTIKITELDDTQQVAHYIIMPKVT